MPGSYHPDILHTTAVADVMTSDVVTLPSTITIGDAIDRWRSAGHGAYPVTEPTTGRCTGIVSRSDLLAPGEDLDARIGDIAQHELVTISPTATTSDALRLILEERVEHLPVVDDGRLVGICTRTDILQARRQELQAEQIQPGWLDHLSNGGRIAAMGRPDQRDLPTS